MTLQPRQYQEVAINKIAIAHRANNSRIVLAASTGSGKTEMSIMIIDNYIKTASKKVLVVAHHTNVIKDNFFARLQQINPDFTFSTTDVNADCFVTIRHNATLNFDMSEFGLIIVDEAHQNYFADTIQSILPNFDHQVLLTATPSKFVAAGGFDILPIARLDIPNKFFSNLSYRIVNVDTDITEADYNASNMVKTAKNIKKNEAISMIDSVITYLGEGKKLFICKDIKHAMTTSSYLNKLGFINKVSDSKSDINGDIINEFKSGQLQNIIVVDRMRVGYSDNDLYYTVDLSFTHNPDIIMQIMSRSNRGNLNQNKHYIKVTNPALNMRTRYMVSLAISLFNADNLVKYAGKIVSDIKIPVLKSSKNTDSKSNASSNNWTLPENIDLTNFFETCDYVNDAEIFNTINNGQNTWTVDSVTKLAAQFTTVSEFSKNSKGAYSFAAMNNLLDKLFPNTTKKTVWTEESIRLAANECKNTSDFCKKFGGAYRIAVANNLLHELFPNSRVQKSWTEELVKAEAAKYTRPTEFAKKNKGAYSFALRNNITLEYKKA